MPLYNYCCKACGHEFSKMCKMDDRKIAEQSPCPECNKEGEVYQVIGTPGFITDHKGTLTRAGQGWRDTLSKIKKNNPRNTIKD